MRFFTYILAVFVLFLSVEPGIASVFMPQQDICSCDNHCTPVSGKKDKREKGKKNPDQGCANCNPFQSCGNCIGYNIPQNLLNTGLIYYISSRQFLFNVHADSPFAFDFWHPPKIS